MPQNISYSEFYENSNKDYLDKLKQQFGKGEIEIALSVLPAIGAIIGRCVDDMTSSDCFKMIPLIKHYMFEVEEKEIKNIEDGAHLYRNVRVFLCKNEERISKKFKVKRISSTFG